MAKATLSTKRIQIDKANVTIVAVTAIATFVTIFSLVACKSLLSQRAYQSRVIAKKEVAKKQLTDNINAVNNLVKSYEQFVSSQENVIGGSSAGTGNRDGDNARIVLDALPSKYDFPALTTSLEKLITDNGNKIVTIQGTDDEVNQDGSADSPNPAPVEMPFQVSALGSYASIQNLIGVFEKSIRPFSMQELNVTGKENSVTIEMKAVTYYQPSKSLNIKKEVIK